MIQTVLPLELTSFIGREKETADLQSYWQRLLVLWLCNYLLYYSLNTLDAFLFTTMTNLGTGIIANLFPALFLSAMIALLWKPGSGNSTDSRSFEDHFSARRPSDWA